MASKKWFEWYRSKRGVIATIYASQKRKSKLRGHPPPSYSKSDLADWLHSQQSFHEVFDAWVSSGYQTEQKPSVDRLDDNRPYTLANLELVQWCVNEARAHENMRNGRNDRHETFPVDQLDLAGNLLARFCSFADASRMTGVDDYSIALCARGLKNKKHAGGFLWRLTDEAAA